MQRIVSSCITLNSALEKVGRVAMGFRHHRRLACLKIQSQIKIGLDLPQYWFVVLVMPVHDDLNDEHKKCINTTDSK